MNPRVWHCPRCGAPLDDVKGAFVTFITCKFCGSKVDLGAEALARHYPVPATRLPQPPPVIQVSDTHAAPTVAQRAPAPPSPFWGRFKIALGPILGLAAGFAGVMCVYVFLRNDEPEPLPAALLMGMAVILGATTDRKIPAILASVWAGALLTAKPFVRPVFWKDGDFFGLTSETHLYYLVPGVMFLATAAIIAMTLGGAKDGDETTEKNKKKSAKPLFHALNAVGLAAGIALAVPAFGGETTKDVIERYRPRFEALRGSLRTIHEKLPPPGSATRDQYRPNMDPRPIFDDKNRTKSNTAILPPEHLLDPSAKPVYDLIISGDLLHSLAWTGPNNPLSGSVLYGQAGDFDNTLERALAHRYVAVYRPASEGLEVFFFDLKTAALLASFRTKPVTGFTHSRRELGLALEKATGGTFSID